MIILLWCYFIEIACMYMYVCMCVCADEIRTPANAIIGASELLTHSSNKLSLDQIELLDTICSSGQHLLTIINDILDLQKITTTNIKLDLHEFDIRQCIEDSIDLVGIKASQKQLTLVYFIDINEDHFDFNIIADSQRIRQILVNFLSNSVKFTSTGQIIIRLSKAKNEIQSDEQGKNDEDHDNDDNNNESGQLKSKSTIKLQISVEDSGNKYFLYYVSIFSVVLLFCKY